MRRAARSASRRSRSSLCDKRQAQEPPDASRTGGRHRGDQRIVGPAASNRTVASFGVDLEHRCPRRRPAALHVGPRRRLESPVRAGGVVSVCVVRRKLLPRKPVSMDGFFLRLCLRGSVALHLGPGAARDGCAQVGRKRWACGRVGTHLACCLSRTSAAVVTPLSIQSPMGQPPTSLQTTT